MLPIIRTKNGDSVYHKNGKHYHTIQENIDKKLIYCKKYILDVKVAYIPYTIRLIDFII